jgi:hypothetical protein
LKKFIEYLRNELLRVGSNPSPETEHPTPLSSSKLSRSRVGVWFRAFQARQILAVSLNMSPAQTMWKKHLAIAAVSRDIRTQE